jgi:hypothetical protein
MVLSDRGRSVDMVAFHLASGVPAYTLLQGRFAPGRSSDGVRPRTRTGSRGDFGRRLGAAILELCEAQVLLRVL